MDQSPVEYVIRLGSEEDGDRIVPFLDQVFGGWPGFNLPNSSLDYWKWKHIDNPRGESLIMLCELYGDLIGVSHNAVLGIKQGESLITVGQSSDLAVHEDYRLMGVRNAIVDEMFKHFPDRGKCYNLTVTRHPHLLQSLKRKQRPRFPHNIQCYVRIQDIQRHLEHIPMDNEWLMKTGYKALSFINAIKQQLTPAPNHNVQRIREISYFDEGVDAFWDQVSSHYEFIGVRDRAYLNWRYCDPRAGDYRVTCAEEDGKLSGYIVTGINSVKPDYPIGYIMDVLSLPDRPWVSSQLLREAVESMEDDGVNIVLCLAVDGNYLEKALSQNGFLNSFQEYEAFVIPTPGFSQHEKIEDYRPERVHYSWGDHDSLPTTLKSS